MKILITGIPCAGKTTLANSLAKEINYRVYNDKDFLIKSNYEVKVEYGQKLKEVDLKRFAKQVNAVLANKENFILEGIIFPFCLKDFAFSFDVIFVLFLNEKRLKKRMKKRDYKEVKILDNLFVQETDILFNTILDSFNSKNLPNIIKIKLSGNKNKDLKRLKTAILKYI